MEFKCEQSLVYTHFVCVYVCVESKCINFEVSVYVFEMGSCCVAQGDWYSSYSLD